MPSVQNVTPVDYQMQVQNQVPQPQEYMSEPGIYDAEFEEKKSAAGGMKGLTALGVILGAAGLGYGIYKHKAAGKYEKQVKALEEEVSKLKQQTQDEKGFKSYVKYTIGHSWIAWPFKKVGQGCKWLWNKMPWVKKAEPPKA